MTQSLNKNTLSAMSIAILGLNHKTAPVALREKLTFSPELIDSALYSLYRHPLVSGCVVLSTCNRTEIYISYQQDSDLSHLQYAIEHWLSQYHNVELDDYKQSLYWYTELDAVEHLMQVSCGIDSMVIGEPQILGQVKQAYGYAQQNDSLSIELKKLFQRVFFVAKKVRTETNIGSSSASVAYSACSIARKLFNDPAELNVMLVGAGETIELIARYLKQHGFNKIIVANRTRQNALKLASSMDAEIISLPDIAVRLKDVDIVVSSTASPLPIIGKGMVERSLACRQAQQQQTGKSAKMLLIDLAVPRDIEAEISQLDDVHLYSIDDLQQIVDSNMSQRMLAAKEASHLINGEAVSFMQWLHSRKAVELIKQYRRQAESIKAELTVKALSAIERGVDVDEVIQKLSYQLTNRLIHAPTQSLLQVASQSCGDCLDMLSDGLKIKKSNT